MVRKLASMAALMVLLPGISTDAHPLSPAQEANIRPVGAPVSCIYIPSISDIRIRDDWTVDFYLAGRKVYRNRLPQRCTGLGLEERFSYTRTASELCSSDAITVQRGFTSVTPGPTCSLGNFQQVSGATRPIVPAPEDNMIGRPRR